MQQITQLLEQLASEQETMINSTMENTEQMKILHEQIVSSIGLRESIRTVIDPIITADYQKLPVHFDDKAIVYQFIRDAEDLINKMTQTVGGCGHGET